MTTRDQKHNSSWLAKQAQRLAVARELPPTARVLEGFAGEGRVYRGCWARFERGACFDLEAVKAASAARERPTWACYQTEARQALAAGLAAHPWDVVDLDCFGSPWAFLVAWLGSPRNFAPLTHVFLTDGYMRQRAIAHPDKLLFPESKGRKGGERLNLTEDQYLERVRERLPVWSPPGLRIELVETRRSGNMRLHYMRATRGAR